MGEGVTEMRRTTGDKDRMLLQLLRRGMDEGLQNRELLCFPAAGSLAPASEASKECCEVFAVRTEQ